MSKCIQTPILRSPSNSFVLSLSTQTACLSAFKPLYYGHPPTPSFSPCQRRQLVYVHSNLYITVTLQLLRSLPVNEDRLSKCIQTSILRLPSNSFVLSLSTQTACLSAFKPLYYGHPPTASFSPCQRRPLVYVHSNLYITVTLQLLRSLPVNADRLSKCIQTPILRSPSNSFVLSLSTQTACLRVFKPLYYGHPPTPSFSPCQRRPLVYVHSNLYITVTLQLLRSLPVNADRLSKCIQTPILRSPSNSFVLSLSTQTACLRAFKPLYYGHPPTPSFSPCQRRPLV